MERPAETEMLRSGEGGVCQAEHGHEKAAAGEERAEAVRPSRVGLGGGWLRQLTRRSGPESVWARMCWRRRGRSRRHRRSVSIGLRVGLDAGGGERGVRAWHGGDGGDEACAPAVGQGVVGIHWDGGGARRGERESALCHRHAADGRVGACGVMVSGGDDGQHRGHGGENDGDEGRQRRSPESRASWPAARRNWGRMHGVGHGEHRGVMRLARAELPEAAARQHCGDSGNKHDERPMGGNLLRRKKMHHTVLKAGELHPPRPGDGHVKVSVVTETNLGGIGR